MVTKESTRLMVAKRTEEKLIIALFVAPGKKSAAKRWVDESRNQR